MLKFLPAGFVGLMVGGLIAANSSTILTHLNWGASYLVHDFYRRFIRRDATEAHYVMAGRLVTIGLFVCSSRLVYLLDTAKDTFDIILQIGAGTGLLYLVRWFWWRVNAWCEVVAMVSSFVVSVLLLVLARNGVTMSTHARAPHHDRRDDGLLGRDRLARAGNGSRGARRVLPEGPAVRPGLGAHSQGGWPAVDRGRGRQHPAGDARLDRRLHGDLVGALHGRQPALHAARRRRDPLRGVHRQRARPGERHADVVGARRARGSGLRAQAKPSTTYSKILLEP